MNPQSRYIGIDLGTTNSAVARIEGVSMRVFRNKAGLEYTPSVVHIGKSGRLAVGKAAYEAAESDPDNAAREFKRNMGSPDPFTFRNSGLTMRPEELSAEVLKVLRADAERATGERITHAIITVPAYFEQPGCQATVRAAALSGMTNVETLIEPVAAGTAYGCDKADANACWLVYDWGGGTFDTAIIKASNGALTIVRDGGNNRLGGSDIDWAIVEQHLMPRVIGQSGFAGLRRGDPQWYSAMAKLKIAAENAKKELSVEESVDIHVEDLQPAEGSASFTLECALRRSELEAIARPLISRTVGICLDVLGESGLSARHIERVILVGGPTMMPIVRQMLVDPKEGLGIPLDLSQDPLTVVAAGAAAFGATRVVVRSEEDDTPIELDKVNLSVGFPAMSPDEEIMGSIDIRSGSGTADYTGWQIELTNRPPGQIEWRSGKMPFNAQGSAVLMALGRRGVENRFEIEVTDAQGRLHDTTPRDFSVAIGGLLPPAAKMMRSLGIALADNSVLVIFPRGEALPAKKLERLYTSKPLKSGERGALLRVPIVEGEELRADRNRLIGTLEIRADRITRDIPFHSPIDLTIQMNASRCITASAELPVLGDEADPIEKVIDSERATPTASELQSHFKALQARLDTLGREVIEIGAVDAAAIIRDIRNSSEYGGLASLVDAGRDGGDPARNAEDSINAIGAKLDQIESSLEWLRLVHKTQDCITEIKGYTDDTNRSSSEQRTRYAELSAQARKAIDDRDIYMLEHLRVQLHSLRAELLRSDSGWVGNLFLMVKNGEFHFSDPARAQQLLARGAGYIEILPNDRFRVTDIAELSRINSELLDLIPDSEQRRLSDVQLH